MSSKVVWFIILAHRRWAEITVQWVRSEGGTHHFRSHSIEENLVIWPHPTWGCAQESWGMYSSLCPGIMKEWILADHSQYLPQSPLAFHVCTYFLPFLWYTPFPRETTQKLYSGIICGSKSSFSGFYSVFSIRSR